ncbi:MAG: Hsp70 family protein, partial [Akkermansiaceae bacterium]|nr:Hsp70 family protein [Akkermansiaceae bacterium]
IEGSSGLSEDEIEKAKREAEAHAEEDKKRAEAVDIKNKGENIVYQVEKQISELPEDAPADLKEMLTTKLDAVKGALKSDDLDLIKSTTEDLEKSLNELAQAAQAAGAQMPDMGGAAPDVAPAEDESDEPRQAKGKVVDAEVVDADK